ncbi:MAG: glucose-6-phosphate dehydrogenase assembly protein OpcA [Bryobacteraceae bacterium]
MENPVTGVMPERILRELDDLWVSLSRQEEGFGSGVLRACSMTFLVLAESGEETDLVAETLALLMRDHPSRAIVMRLDGDSRGRLESQVLAQCWMPFGHRRQICCERVEITSSPDELPAVAPLLRALIAPDLPVVLWCRNPERLESAALSDIFDLAGKVIVDSGASADPRAAVAVIGRARAAGRLVGDLAWTRLTRTRESIAQLYADPSNEDRMGSIRKAVRECSDEAGYLSAWLNRALPGIDFGHAAPLLERAPNAEAEWLSEEISILGRDRVYEEVLRA